MPEIHGIPVPQKAAATINAMLADGRFGAEQLRGDSPGVLLMGTAVRVIPES